MFLKIDTLFQIVLVNCLRSKKKKKKNTKPFDSE